MKILIRTVWIVSLAMAGAVFVSCSNDLIEPPPIFGPSPLGVSPPGFYTDIQAKKNGYPFVASGWSYHYSDTPDSSSLLMVQFHTFAEYGARRELCTVYNLPVRIGVYYVNDPDINSHGVRPTAAYGTLTSDGDVVEDSYELDVSSSSWIVITHVDTLDNRVTGNFELSFVIRT
ncbi:MAG: hypothetical protein DRI69_11755, partial [Bacteroidetes bacterium]